MKTLIRNRAVVVVLLLLLPLASVVATGTQEKESTSGAAAVSGGKYNEAPELTAKVAGGELPPVDERLPIEPLVVNAARNGIPKGQLDFEVGRYGGTLRSVQPDPAWNPDIFVMNDEPLLAAPGILADGIEGNVLKSYEVSSDGKVFTFQMREGLRWSDGEYVTSEDVRFTYEDFLLNERLTPVFPRWMRAASKTNGDPLKVEIIDEYSFRISFTERYDGFPAYLSIVMWKGYTELIKPSHYLKKYHARYTPLEELEEEIAKEGLSKGEWWTLFNQRDILNWELTRPPAVGFPTLNPWMLVSTSPTTATYERNPYYFKVDAEGNQLPYIDGIRSQVVADVEMSNLKVLAGEVDFLREDATLDKLDLYKENEARAGYKVVLLDMHVSPTDPRLNLTNSDPVWQSVVRDVRFRTALSHAIDREEIIDAIYFGFAEPSSLVPSTYDPAKANKLLDGMGLDKRDNQGFRLGPDGKVFEIPFEIVMSASDHVPVTELIMKYWKAVGLKVTMKTLEGGLWNTRRDANELKGSLGWHHGPELWWGALWDFVPNSWGRAWMIWFNTGGNQGEEPPADVQKFMSLMDESIARSGSAREEAIKTYRKLMYENVYIILNVEKVKYPLIVNKNLANVPHAGFAIAANFAAEQMFYRK